MYQESNQELKILVEQAQNGNKDAFKKIFDSLSDRFFAYIFSRTSNRDDALDICQETFIDLWKSLKRFRYKSDQSFNGFIFTIIKRKLYHYYKNKQKIISLDKLDEKQLAQPIEEQNDYEYILQHIDTLTSGNQDIIRLRYWSQMTFNEIAAVLNITESAAKVRHHRALQKLKINFKKNSYVI
ncbi:MAG: sigma-70 family RNA polymerase sigma factor [Patescibacteria group bacterium]|nr:sigma-70 family RNA polymerase sigma factor [Patescibacteria group bacterium]